MALQDELVPKPCEKTAKRPVCNPRKTTFFERFCCLQLPAGKRHGSEGRASTKTTLKNSLTCRLKSPRKTTFFETAGSRTASKKSSYRQAVEQLRKKVAAGRKTPWLRRTSECQNHVKKLPNVSSEILEKQAFSRLLTIEQLRKKAAVGRQ